ncbi:MAG: NAD(P)-dependent oxidoreductase, partial [Pseudomonadota bacterium]
MQSCPRGYIAQNIYSEKPSVGALYAAPDPDYSTLMQDFRITSVAILEPQEEVVAAHVAAARPDLKLHVGADAAVPEEPFALAAFDPGKPVSRFRAAKWVHCNGAGVDKLFRQMDFVPPVMSRTVGLMGEQMAEYVLAYVLADAQKISERASCQARRIWAKQEMLPTFQWGRRAVIFGTGQIAQVIAARLQAFGIACDGVSRSGRAVAPF